MTNPQSPNAPKRRVGIYERLEQSTSAAPGGMFGIGLAVLAVVVIVILLLSGYW